MSTGDAELEQILQGIDELNRELDTISNSQSQGTVLTSILGPASALIVGILAWVGVSRQSRSASATALTAVEAQQEQHLLEKVLEIFESTSERIAKIDVSCALLYDAALTATTSEQDRDDVGKKADIAAEQMVAMKRIGAKLALSGIDVSIFNLYVKAGHEFIGICRRGGEVDEIKGAYESFDSVSTEFLNSLERLGSSFKANLRSATTVVPS